MEKVLQTDWILLSRLSLPILILLGVAILFLVFSPFLSRGGRRHSGLFATLAALTVLLALVACWRAWLVGASLSMGLLLFDRVSYGFDLVFLTATLMSVILSKDYVGQEKMREGEYFSLLLFATAGSMILAHGADLIVIFLGLEIVSLAAYILAGMKRDSIRSYEASLKYFILGSFASGFLLYGIAMAYGATGGSTTLESLSRLTMPPAEPVLVYLMVALLLIGIGFKIAAVPFHLWSPDVYEGSPTSVTAYMASVIKAAGFAVLVRVVLALGHIPEIPWVGMLSILAAATMIVGNTVALRQTNIKRMLAYSSIAHAGYALVGVTAALQKNALAESTLGAVIFYLFAYSITTLGAFGVVMALGRRGDQVDEMSDLSGLSERHPFLAAAMAIFMFSLMGIPPSIGFVGKFYVFSGAIDAGLYGLVIVGVLNSVVSAYYYLGPVVRMYFQKERPYELPPLTYALVTGIIVCLFAVIYLGIFPSNLFLIARESVRQIVF